MSGEDEDFMSSFKKSMNAKGSVIEELQVTIKEKELLLGEKEEEIEELKKKIKELSLIAKDSLMERRTGAASAPSSEELEEAKERLAKQEARCHELEDEVAEYKKADDRLKRVEKKVEEQKKEILKLRGKKDFDLSQFLEEGEDPTLVAQIRVLKTRIKSLERQVVEDELDELKAELQAAKNEADELRDKARKQESTIKDLEARCDILERSPPPPAPPSPSGGKPDATPSAPSCGPPEPPAAPSAPLPPSPVAQAPIGAPTGNAPVTPGAPPGGGNDELAKLQRECQQLTEKYNKLAGEMDSYRENKDPTTILNLKTQRIFDLQDEIKRLRKQMQEGAELAKARADLACKDEEVAKLQQERETIIAYYNDLKEKYAQIYEMIQQRDSVIAELQARLQS